MAGKEQAIPKDFLDHLCKRIKPLGNEAKPIQMNVARMLWFGTYRNRQHAKYADSQSYTYQELDEWFGRRKFPAVNERLGLFDITHWSQDGKFTKAYQLKAETAIVLERYFSKRDMALTAMLYGDGAELRAIPAAIASKDATGRTTKAWPEADSLRLVKVDIENMLALRDELARNLRDRDKQLGLFTGSLSRNKLQSLLDDVRHLITLAKTKAGGRGYIAHRYVQASSGRLYAKGWNLQSTGAIVKQAALAGLWEYDFANCHYAILMQMAERFGRDCPAIKGYLANKKAVREAIAKEAGISIDQAKVCLLAIMYGARQSLWPTNAIPNEIGTEAAERLFSSDLFKNIQADIKEARRTIVGSWPRDRQGRVANMFGRCIGGKATPEQILAHLIQGVEATALRAILRLYPEDIVLVQHDGFASRCQLSPSAIEAAVLEATGYVLAIEEDRIQLELDNYFMRRRIQNEKGRKRSHTKAFSNHPAS